jgi:hypothetical protein
VVHLEALSHQPMRIMGTFIQNRFHTAYRNYQLSAHYRVLSFSEINLLASTVMKGISPLTFIYIYIYIYIHVISHVSYINMNC